MRHIKQRKNECFPTVLAMLSGESIDKIIAGARVIIPTCYSWEYVTQQDASLDGDLAMAYRHLARKYAPYLLDYVAPVSVKVCAEQKLYMSYRTFIDKTRLGRGAVILCSRYASRPGGHIAAFENGIIFDPGEDGPMPAHDYYCLWAKLKPESNRIPLCPIYVVSEY